MTLSSFSAVQTTPYIECEWWNANGIMPEKEKNENPNDEEKTEKGVCHKLGNQQKSRSLFE